MPPIKGLELVSAELYTALRHTGHGDRIVIGDPSLPFAREKHDQVKYPGTAAQALLTVLGMVDPEGPIAYMARDIGNSTEFAKQAGKEFHEVANKLHLPPGVLLGIPRLDDDASTGVGFYTYLSNLESEMVPGTKQLFIEPELESFPFAVVTFAVKDRQNSQWGAVAQRAL